MNIGVDIKHLNGGQAGIRRYIKRVLEELQRIDSENQYCLFEPRPSNYAPPNPAWKKISHNSKLPGTVWMQTALPGLMKKHNIDIFWAPQQIAPVFGLPGKVSLVTTIHDFTFLHYPKTCRPTDLLIKKLLTASTVEKSAALIPVSDHIKKELLDFYPRAGAASKIVRTVYNGVDGWDTWARQEPRENFLFFPGSLEPRKNLSRLIKALEIVNENGTDINLRICGPQGWKNSNFYRQVELSPVRDKIKHLGFLSDNELKEQYLKCKAVIFPSIYEGFGLPVLEALTLNTPVLTSKGTAMEEIAGESAVYFDPYNVNSIAETIINFSKSEPVLINRERLKKYTWEQSAKDLLAVFKECAASHTMYRNQFSPPVQTGRTPPSSS
ncbi:MAG: glycosyltransferase family 4 protein [Chitinispirillia bacterium]|nr:glycosyltransferase family 4 protein [Chitinispirillia bacterium]MCL2267892.1 glycosyltransferase family 4 protein [Chitinispirillia bacterium]